MLRSAEAGDRDAILALVLSTGLLEAGEIDALAAIFDSQTHEASAVHPVWTVNDDSGDITAVAYAEPEVMAEGAWNLRLIAVHPGCQRGGLGSALLGFVERALADMGGRLLVVDTSGHEAFAGVRDFYRRAGYVQEATIRDFWQPGDDKVVFTKRLPPAVGPV